MRAPGLEQYISGPTHVKDSTLDLIFMQLIALKSLIPQYMNSSQTHCMVSVNINIKKQKYSIETKEIRDRTKITGPTLGQNFTTPEFNEDRTIDEATSQFNMKMFVALNAIASIKSIKFTNRPKHPWFNKFIREQSRLVENHERRWRKYKLQHQQQASMKERNVYNRLLIYHKKQTISKKINESKNDTKQPFYIINNITMSKTPNTMS